jgi:hypothetical protein
MQIQIHIQHNSWEHPHTFDLANLFDFNYYHKSSEIWRLLILFTLWSNMPHAYFHIKLNPRIDIFYLATLWTFIFHHVKIVWGITQFKHTIILNVHRARVITTPKNPFTRVNVIIVQWKLMSSSMLSMLQNRKGSLCMPKLWPSRSLTFPLL